MLHTAEQLDTAIAYLEHCSLNRVWICFGHRAHVTYFVQLLSNYVCDLVAIEFVLGRCLGNSV